MKRTPPPAEPTAATKEKIAWIGRVPTSDGIVKVNCYNAAPLPGDQPLVSAELASVGRFPDFSHAEYRSGQSRLVHDANAEAILEYLSSTLPGGTIDLLAALLLQRMAGDLIVRSDALDNGCENRRSTAAASITGRRFGRSRSRRRSAGPLPRCWAK